MLIGAAKVCDTVFVKVPALSCKKERSALIRDTRAALKQAEDYEHIALDDDDDEFALPFRFCADVGHEKDMTEVLTAGITEFEEDAKEDLGRSKACLCM